jgi:hypothetical protein
MSVQHSPAQLKADAKAEAAAAIAVPSGARVPIGSEDALTADRRAQWKRKHHDKTHPRKRCENPSRNHRATVANVVSQKIRVKSRNIMENGAAVLIGSKGALGANRRAQWEQAHHNKMHPPRNGECSRRDRRATVGNLIAERFIGKTMENRQEMPRYRPAPKAPSAPTDEHNWSKRIVIRCIRQKMATVET